MPLANCVTVPLPRSRDPGHGLTEAEDHVQVSQVIAQGLDDLGVAEVEERRSRVDDRHASPESGEHRCVLEPDDPRADDDQRVGDPLELQDRVRIEDGEVVELDVRHLRRNGSRPDHERRRRESSLTACPVLDHHRPWIDETSDAADQVHVVAQQLIANHASLPFDDLTHAFADIAGLDLLAQPVALTVDPALIETSQVQDGLPYRLRGNRAGVHAHAADAFATLDHRDVLPKLRGLDRRLLPGGTGADNEEVVLVGHSPSFTAIGSMRCVEIVQKLCRSGHSTAANGTSSGTSSGPSSARALFPPSATTARAVTRWYRIRSWTRASASER